ncbi:MAG: cytochrome c, partial [Gammaproteobacteria bacterium]|nr:cytochrome c [Gammaproteobacteria bacterium]MBT5172345.1 cytochrome c [Gammaproteobacteria bacterium]MBT5510149.1 cytochrome c [Gammaproteobacteria bacterium]MBT5742265.1 cytochrome c [Gammaproteobacteria bacterium]
MYCVSQNSTGLRKGFVSFGLLLSMSFLLVGTGKLYAAAEPGLAFEALYEQQCAVCHGNELQGEAIGVPLVGGDLLHGESLEEVAVSIAEGYPNSGMPAWSEALTTTQIRTLAVFIVEQRDSMPYGEFNVRTPMQFPEGVVASDKHAFTVEPVVEGLDQLTFSMA